MTRPQLFVIRGPDGKPEAIHQRTASADGGKTFAWWSLGPDRKPVAKLQGKVAELPLFGSQHVGAWDTSRPVIVVEGEKAMLTLAEAGHRALGTVSGSTSPGPGPLAVLIGFDVVLWPDNDDSGRKLMLAVARQIRSLSPRLLIWPDAPPKGDAADAIGAGADIDALIAGAVPIRLAELTKPIDLANRRKAKASLTFHDGERPIERFNASVPVSEILRREHGLIGDKVKPGKTVSCPFHRPDEHPSLSIFEDDKRVFCHVGTCWANNDGRGRHAWDLANARQAVAT